MFVVLCCGEYSMPRLKEGAPKGWSFDYDELETSGYVTDQEEVSCILTCETGLATS